MNALRPLSARDLAAMATRRQPPSPRSGGVLLHPTSLPGPFGVGDLGPAAEQWIDFLARAGQTWWQILPLGPTGYGDSPYQSFSAFAGNPYLISPDRILEDGLVSFGDLFPPPLPIDSVDYGQVISFKIALLRKAWGNFRNGAGGHLRAAFDDFRQARAGWLDDYALFMALKDEHGGASWETWEESLLLRKPEALAAARSRLADTIGEHAFRQFLFFRQWDRVKRYAAERGIRLIGDVPIFVSGDSADVWAMPELFLLDARRRPTVVAGVPPDFFSATGQLWGNPHYNWDVMKQTGYAWWVDRMRAALEQVDLVRLDHFRGFEAAWRVPAGEATAMNGAWVPGPGADLFTTLQDRLGGLPLIAEDLGVITPPVEELREQFDLPGMRILQFAFGGQPEDRFLPHNYERNTVVYTGTHDNDTTRGWYDSLQPHERDFLRRYIGRDGSDIAWDLIRLAWMSVADFAVVPLQDLLDLGGWARMNLPGRPSGNWGWRFRGEQLTPFIADRLGMLTELYARKPAKK